MPCSSYTSQLITKGSNDHFHQFLVSATDMMLYIICGQIIKMFMREAPLGLPTLVFQTYVISLCRILNILQNNYYMLSTRQPLLMADRECNCFFFFISNKFSGLIFNMEYAV